MKIKGVTREGFLALFYSFLLSAEYNYDIGDSYELMEKFTEDIEFIGPRIIET